MSHAIFFYLKRDYKNKFFKYFKRLVLLIVIFSLIVLFISLPRSYEFYQMAHLKFATYDVVVSPEFPLTENDLNRIKNLSIIDDVLGETDIGGGSGLLVNNTQIFVERIAFVSDMDKASRLVYSTNLLIDGEFKRGYAVIDWLLADMLHAKVGDKIAINFTKNILVYPISGIIYSGSGTFITIIVQVDNKTKELLSNFLLRDVRDKPYQNRYAFEKPLYYDIYLKLRKPVSNEEIAGLLSSVLSVKIDPIRVDQRLDMLNSARSEFLRNWQENSFYQFLYWGSIVLYGVLVFRDSISKFEERKRDLALLLALGLNVRSVIFMVFIELFVMFVIVTSVSIIMNILYYKYMIRFIILQQQVMLDILYSSMLINFVVILLSVVLVAVLLFRLRLVKVLNEG